MPMGMVTVILYQQRAFDGTLESLATKMGTAKRAQYGAYDGFEVSDSDGMVFVYTETNEERLAVMRRAAIAAHGEKAKVAAIQRCDAMLCMLWDGEGEIADLSLEFSYLEPHVSGVTYYARLREVLDDSFSAELEFADLAPISDDEIRRKLIGVWQTPDTEMTITASGDLVYSTSGRILLTYHVKDGDLITDQPSKPNPVRTPISFDKHGRLYSRDLGATSVFTRATSPRDPDAALSALVGFALQHGVMSATVGGDPMSPFVVVEGEDGRRNFVRFAGGSPDTAIAAARSMAATGQLCVFALDASITVSGEKWDAIIVEGSRPGRATSMKAALRYAVAPELDGTAVPEGVQLALPDGESLYA